MKKLTNAGLVIDALGGTAAVAKLTNSKPTAVSNWRERGLPPDTFVVLTSALMTVGCWAPLALWGMQPPNHERSKWLD